MATTIKDTSGEAKLPVQTPLIETRRTYDLKEYPYPYKTLHAVGGETKRLEWDFTKSPFKTIELLQMTDMQYGHQSCNYGRIREFRDWILKAPNRFMLWTGDNVDAASMETVGTPWENIGTPQMQLFNFCEEWAPARHRILSYVGGNHERRTLRTFGDLGIEIAASLRLPYSRGRQAVDIKFGDHKPFKITQWHGAGGARTKGTVAQVLYRFASDGDSQVYLMGHLHQPMVIPFWKERRGDDGKIKAVKTVAAIGSSFLELWNSYGEVAGYAPGDVLMPRIVLDRDGGWEVSLR